MPELCSYIDSMDVETVLESSTVIGALNLNAICTDNPTDLGANSFTVLTNTDLMPDPAYDPLAGYSWWDRNWKSVIRYGLFAITFAVSVILMCILGTQAFGIGMFQAGLGAAISGAVVGGIIGGIMSAVQGNGFFKGFADGAITGFVDGFTAGAILYCISSAVSAISKNSNGATISNHVTGTKIHKGFMENGKYFKDVGLRVDGLKNGILYELKPRNAKSIMKAIGQMKKYQNASKNIIKLVLVLY